MCLPFTGVAVTKDVLSKYQKMKHLEDLHDRWIKNQHDETSQLHNYINTSIHHVTTAMMEKISDLDENINERLNELRRNMKENLISFQSVTYGNDEKIIKTLNSAFALSLERMSAVEVNHVK